MAKFKVADFSRKVDLGSPKSHTTGAGLNITSFVPNYSLHFKQQTRTLWALSWCRIPIWRPKS